MKKMNLNNESMSKIIISLVLLVIGILFCFLYNRSNIISTLFGSIIIVLGVLSIVMTFIGDKKVLTVKGALGAGLIAFGIFFIINIKIIAGLLTSLVPYSLICIGSLIVLDSILSFAKVNNKKIALGVMELIVGLGLLALGICLILIDDFEQYAYLILGIVIIALAAFLLVTAFLVKDQKNKK